MHFSKPIRLAASASVAVLLTLNFLFAQLSFRSAHLALPGDQFDELLLPRADVIRAVFLNHTFAADLAWIAMNVNVGAARQAHWKLERLFENAGVVQELDPRFYRLYEWFPAVWAFTHTPLDFEEAEVATTFLERGMDAFPNDTRLPFSAAMSYVGMTDVDMEAKIRRYRRIIGLLERSLAGDNVHPDNAFVLSYHRRKLREFETGERPSLEEERDFYTYLYMRSINPETRERLALRLKNLPDPDAVSARLLQQDATFELHRQTALPYLAPDLFSLLAQENE